MARDRAVTALRLLIIDDHPVVLSGIRLLLAADPRFGLCGEAASAAAGCAVAEAEQPDLIITDLVMGGADGIALIQDLRTIAPAATILVYSSHDERLWARRVLQAGARAFVPKAMPLDLLATALETVIAGGIHVSADVQQMLVRDVADGRDESPDVASLSARELQVLTLMANGLSLQALGQQLGVSVKTVGTYRERLKIKLGLDTVRALDRFAAERLSSGAL
jgi:two-component system response regulator NreC